VASALTLLVHDNIAQNKIK